MGGGVALDACRRSREHRAHAWWRMRRAHPVPASGGGGAAPRAPAAARRATGTPPEASDPGGLQRSLGTRFEHRAQAGADLVVGGLCRVFETRVQAMLWAGRITLFMGCLWRTLRRHGTGCAQRILRHACTRCTLLLCDEVVAATGKAGKGVTHPAWVRAL